MIDLESRTAIAKIDRENVLGSIEQLPKQCLHAWEEVSKINIPANYKKIKNLVMGGMGGSGLGARVIESLFSRHLKVPLIRINDYNLPDFVDQDSLVVCSSYSGETEEVVNNARQAIHRKAKWMAIGIGNTLIDLAKKHQVPYYQINPLHNPSKQPRMAVGYSIVGQLALVSRTGLITVKQTEIENSVKLMQQILQEIKVEIPQQQNPAKKLALQIKNKIVWYISAEHLVGAVHTVSNQLNENAKNLTSHVQIPELNHHLMEGFEHPRTNPHNLLLVLVNSTLYSQRIQKRFAITRDVVEKNGLKIREYLAQGNNILSQAFSTIQFGTYTNLYLSLLYEQNPAAIKWVDYFKTQLGQPLGK